jgi:hypothetical protein
MFHELIEDEDFVIMKKTKDFFALEGCFSLGHIPDDEEELLTPEMGRLMEQGRCQNTPTASANARHSPINRN